MDPEISAISKIKAALEPLEQDAGLRVLTYVWRTSGYILPELDNPRPDFQLSDEENAIFAHLSQIIPTAANSYKQALFDLSSENRISYRGMANELREAIRETLDYLAPDEKVVSQDNFKYEAGRNAPTMKQKVRYILKTRGLPENSRNAPEDAVALVEERMAAFARSVYERSSISAHIATQKKELLQVKAYVNAIFADLLDIHSAKDAG